MTAPLLRTSLIGTAFVIFVSACSESTPHYYAAENPLRLSDWNLFTREGSNLVPNEASIVFRPANQLFSDYSQKLRTLWMPDDSQAHLVDEEIEYPVGTVISKTFYYPTDTDGHALKQIDLAERQIDLSRNKIIETRLMVRRDASWDAFPYVWNEEETEAFLRIAGSSIPINLKSDTGDHDFVYFVPNENQCSGCHVTSHPAGDMHPLGAIATQLTAAFDYPKNNTELQIDKLVARGWLTKKTSGSSPVSWRDEAANLEARALSYLNIQCGHCHNPEGPADTSSLILDGSHKFLINMGVCKTPVAAGGGSGDMLYSIVPGAPDRSILLYRMRSSELDEMMPELGRSLIHSEGISLISRWIGQLPGSCS